VTEVSVGGGVAVAEPVPVLPAAAEVVGARAAAGGVSSLTGRALLVKRALLIADLAALGLAYTVAVSAAHRGPATPTFFLIALVPALPIWFVGAHVARLYVRDEQRPEHSTLDELGPIFQLVSVATWLCAAGMYVAGQAVPDRGLLAFWAASLALITAGRVTARAVVRRHPAYTQKTVVVGAGEVGQLVARKLVHHPEFGLRVLGFVDAQPKEMRADLEQLPVLGPTDEIAEIVRAKDVDRVLLAFSNDRHDALVDVVRSLRDLEVQIDVVPRLFDAIGPGTGVHQVEGLPLMTLTAARPNRLARRCKRVLDLALASALLTLALPLFAWIAWRIKRDSPGPVFFRQTRLGEGRQPFSIWKFRTMAVDTDDGPHREYIRSAMDVRSRPENGNLYKLDRPRDVTRVGAWLRKTSLDELPQLINVVCGEMSLVGPRPCLVYETELFEPHHFDRFLVPAGMTGLWQVTARARATFKEALDLDAAYARGWSLGLDLSLLARTPLSIARERVTR
jgi:exopolysaccharide biosynthesis polyprenyl glycosylphosphotransferase